MTPRSPELGLLLERKQWKASPEDRGDYTIKISLKQEQESFRHEWTDTLLAKLKEVVPKYTNKFGQIQWKDLQEAEPDFKDFSTGATRKTYEQQIKSATPETVSSTVVNVQAIKTRFIEVVCRFQSEKNTIQWDALLESDPIFNGLTVQHMRTIMTKLTEAEKTVMENNKKAFDEEVRTLLSSVIGKYKNARGGVAWDNMINENPLFQIVGISHLKKIVRKLTDLKETNGEAQQKRKALAYRLKVLVQDPQYVLSTGKIKWKLLVDTEPLFQGLNPDVLRVMYKSL
jgi:hypothetical protein